MAKTVYGTYWIGIPHLRIRREVINSPAWSVLSFSGKALYVDLRAKLQATNNGNINAVLSELKHTGWVSSATLSKALRELQALGFIAKTRQGGIASLSKVCSLYRFTDLTTYEHPKQGVAHCKATFDYRRFESIAAAKSALRESVKKKSKVQESKLAASRSEALAPKLSSIIEADDHS